MKEQEEDEFSILMDVWCYHKESSKLSWIQQRRNARVFLGLFGIRIISTGGLCFYSLLNFYRSLPQSTLVYDINQPHNVKWPISTIHYLLSSQNPTFLSYSRFFQNKMRFFILQTLKNSLLNFLETMTDLISCLKDTKHNWTYNWIYVMFIIFIMSVGIIKPPITV